MTYQVTMLGVDGIVIASDRRQLIDPHPAGFDGCYMPNDFTKVFIDPTGRFAWAFAGGKAGFVAAQYLRQEFAKSVVEPDARKILQDCCDRAAMVGDPHTANSVILADGENRCVIHAVIEERVAGTSDVLSGICFTGQSSNRASVIPSLYYSSNMTVAQLARLAAYAVVTAGKVDSLYIGGLDVVAYRSRTGRFQALPLADMEREAVALDDGIKALISGEL